MNGTCFIEKSLVGLVNSLPIRIGRTLPIIPNDEFYSVHKNHSKGTFPWILPNEIHIKLGHTTPTRKDAMQTTEKESCSMMLPPVLEKRPSLKGIKLVPVIKGIRPGQPGSLKGLPRKTQIWNMEEIAQHAPIQSTSDLQSDSHTQPKAGKRKHDPSTDNLEDRVSSLEKTSIVEIITELKEMRTLYGASVKLEASTMVLGDYRDTNECRPIHKKEADAVLTSLLSLCSSLQDSRVDLFTDDMAVIGAWENQGCKSRALSCIMKEIFSHVSNHNIDLHLKYVTSCLNEADAPSRVTNTEDSMLSDGSC
ncbi:unnamed protein product [Mytilus coruscus]|uniref:Uncharacterized protein n=1 Tax=Mytilus coruscus TaxID=42192 RepID=A0A6J8BAT0_MYTCO|nr:unnamed protein product [Mytilus coruscus]